MSQDLSKEVLELSYQEMKTRLDNRIQERIEQRRAAIRTFTASLLFVSVITAVVSIFPERVFIQYGREPVTGIRDVIGPLVTSWGLLCIFLSVFTSLYAIRDIPQNPMTEFSRTVPDLVSSEHQHIGVRTSETTVYPRESEEQWLRGISEEYANALYEARSESQRSTSEMMVNFSYFLISVGISLAILGIWITLI